MLKQVTILKDGQFVQGAQFTSDAEMNTWLDNNQAKKSWGDVGTYTVNVTDFTSYADQEAVKDQQRDLAIQQLKTVYSQIDSATTIAQVATAIKVIIRALRYM